MAYSGPMLVKMAGLPSPAVPLLAPLPSPPVSPARFRRILADLGLSQREAARRLYVEASTVQRWVQGRRTIPGPVIACLESWERERRALEALKRERE